MHQMAFATLQEAWGVTAFQSESSLKTSPVREPRPPVRAYDGGRPAGGLADSSDRLPAGRSPRETLQRYMDGVYARSGARGVARVLGPRMVAELCSLGRGRHSALDWLADEENVLIVLVAAFIMLLLADALR